MPRGVYDRSHLKKKLTDEIVVPKVKARRTRRIASPTVASTIGESFDLSLPIPTGGLHIKLTTKKTVVGTLICTTDRITFVGRKGHKAKRSSVPYETLARLFETGLFG